MNSSVIKRSIVIAGHKTSVSLEEAFWTALKEIAIHRRMTPSALVASIDGERKHDNLSSCLRLFVLDSYLNRVAEKLSTRNARPDLTVACSAPGRGGEPVMLTANGSPAVGIALDGSTWPERKLPYSRLSPRPAISRARRRSAWSQAVKK